MTGDGFNTNHRNMEWSTPTHPVQADATSCKIWCWTKVPTVTKHLPHHNKYVLDSEPRITRSTEQGLWMWFSEEGKNDNLLPGSAAIPSLAGVHQEDFRNHTSENTSRKEKSQKEIAHDVVEGEVTGGGSNDELSLRRLPHSIPLPLATTPQAISIHPSKEWIVLGVDGRLVLLVNRGNCRYDNTR